MRNFFARLFGRQQKPIKTDEIKEENEPQNPEEMNEPILEEELTPKIPEKEADEISEPKKEIKEEETPPLLTLTDAQSYKHQGKREYQEDNSHIGNHYLIVSDGMGGHAKGDVASEIVVKTLIHQLEQFSESDADTPSEVKAHLQIMMQSIVTALNEYAIKEPMAYKMGATLVMALLIKDTLYAIHIGDSRIYLFDEQGKIKFVTKDHSFVQELIDTGLITAEEALTHPRRNVITRVLQAKEGLRVKATITVLENIATNDKLLLCSDGVLEAWRDDGLSVIFGRNFDNTRIITEIQKHCAKRSSDNNTAIVATLTK